MEGNDWYARTGYTDYRNHFGGDDRPLDEDVFRGAYRFDNSSRHRNETTYDGFDRNNRRSDYNRGEQNQGGDYVYNRSGRMHDEDFTRNNVNYGNRQQYGDNRFSRDRDEQYRPRSGGYGTRFGGDAGGNFNNDWSPDRYGSRNRGENYGNMAGPLSFGYDGDYNSDQDHNRHYDPLSGRMRNDWNNNRQENRGNRNQSRRYGPPDEFGMNPDYDRY